ncbi:MAG: MFS transporter [Acidimicrobiales bacterium]
MARTIAQPSAPPPAAASGQALDVDSGRAWVIALGGMLANAVCFGTVYSFGAFLDAMKAEFGSGLGATALIFGLPTFVLFSLGLLTGPLADRYGPRRIVLTGAVVIGAGLFLTSRAQSLGAAVLFYGVGVGVGIGCCLVPVTACVGGWFVRRRALALGLTASGIGVGTLVMVPLAEWMNRAYGWRSSYEVFALACAGALALTAWAATPPRRNGAAPKGRPLRQLAALGSFRRLYAGSFLLSMALFVPFVFLVKYAKDHGVSASSAALLVSVLGASNVASRLAMTGLAARLGAPRLFLLCFLVQPPAYALWLASRGAYPALVVFAVVLGASHGGFVALSAEVAAQLFGVAGLGGVLGALWTAPGIGGLIGPVSVGFVIDAGGFTPAILAAMALSAAAAALQLPFWRLRPR